MKKRIQHSILIVVIALCGYPVKAQVASIPFTAALDTFSVITGTTLDTSGVDDIIYPNLPIGFNFSLGGITHDRMTVSTNGFIELDSNSTRNFFNILNGSSNNVIAPFGADLIHSNPAASIQYVTLGAAPNRVTVVQWLHYSYFGGSGDVSFQIWLFETSNCIRFIYGANNLVNNPLHTQIGLRGDTSSDFLVLGDTSCNWASAYPYPSINTQFPVSLSCNMPSGFAFHFGACAGGNGVNFSYMTGKVFNDANGNGTMDSGETGIPNHVVHITPGNYYVSSDANGDYTFFFSDSTLTYNLSTGSITWSNQTNVPAVISCNPQTQSCHELNFGFQQIPNVHEVSITCPNWGAKPGQPEPMPIHYVNNGTATESDTITFVMDSLYSFISSTPAPASVNGQTIQWVYSTLAPGQHGTIMLYLLPDSSAVMGNYLSSTLSIGPLNDTFPANNVLNLHQLITRAWDPNEKVAEPSGEIPVGTEIQYTIHFQNTGNASASNVSIEDALDESLDPLTFRLIGASHAVNFSMVTSGIIHFTFYNIQLPDSGSDLAGSNGYVTYTLKTRTALAPGTVINNRAGIIFDSNPPVLTNTTVDIIESILSISNPDANVNAISVFPNPASGHAVFFFSANLTERADLRITSIEGKTVLYKKNITPAEIIDFSSLTPGVYLGIVRSAEGIRTVKFTKE